MPTGDRSKLKGENCHALCPPERGSRTGGFGVGVVAEPRKHFVPDTWVTLSPFLRVGCETVLNDEAGIIVHPGFFLASQGWGLGKGRHVLVMTPADFLRRCGK